MKISPGASEGAMHNPGRIGILTNSPLRVRLLKGRYSGSLMRSQGVAFFCLFPAIALADPVNDLLVAQEKLIAAITHTLEIQNLSCTRGDRNSCQDALLSSAELNIVKSEIALEKLGDTVRSSEIGDMIDEATNELSDIRSTLDEIQEKLDE